MIRCLAPLENFTDIVYRQVLCQIGKPDVMFTEFMNVDVFCTLGRDGIRRRVLYEEIERPLIIQLWGVEPQNYTETISYLLKEGIRPDGFDLNMGCSIDNLTRDGSGARLITTPKRAKEIIHAAQDAAQDVPVSVKTRLGFYEIETEAWSTMLLSQGLSMLTMHGRIGRKKYGEPANWAEIRKVVALRDALAPQTKVIGNGDIRSVQEGEEKAQAAGTDGYMIGREAMLHPWVFTGRSKAEITRKERLDALVLHIQLYEKHYGEERPFHSQHKYFRSYMNNFSDARILRREMDQCHSPQEVYALIERAREWYDEHGTLEEN